MGKMSFGAAAILLMGALAPERACGQTPVIEVALVKVLDSQRKEHPIDEPLRVGATVGDVEGGVSGLTCRIFRGNLDRIRSSAVRRPDHCLTIPSNPYTARSGVTGLVVNARFDQNWVSQGSLGEEYQLVFERRNQVGKSFTIHEDDFSVYFEYAYPFLLVNNLAPRARAPSIWGPFGSLFTPRPTIVRPPAPTVSENRRQENLPASPCVRVAERQESSQPPVLVAFACGKPSADSAHAASVAARPITVVVRKDAGSG